jgi:hypothetical protein
LPQERIDRHGRRASADRGDQDRKVHRVAVVHNRQALEPAANDRLETGHPDLQATGGATTARAEMAGETKHHVGRGQTLAPANSRAATHAPLEIDRRGPKVAEDATGIVAATNLCNRGSSSERQPSPR